MIVPGDQLHRFLIHDRDRVYAEGVGRTLAAMRLEVLKTPVRAPQANAYCERLIGTIRRECFRLGDSLYSGVNVGTDCRAV